MSLQIWSKSYSFYPSGTRGATSAEYFLKAGYAVIFMHRQFSLQPFSRHYSHSTNPFLDFLDIEETPSTTTTTTTTTPMDSEQGSPATTTTPRISVTPNEHDALLGVLAAYKKVHALGLLHTLTFVTVDDYLWLLRAVSKEMSVLNRRALFYLAAAVSDFFLPRQKLVRCYSLFFVFFCPVSRALNDFNWPLQSEHKIQSGKGSLHIEMDQVPKILKPMVDEWTPGGFVVSFKVGPPFSFRPLTSLISFFFLFCLKKKQLETDQALLIPKARQALERYGHQVVIGNDLHRRKFEVVFVSKKPLPSLPPGIEQTSEAVGRAAELSNSFHEMWLRIDIQETLHPGFPVKEIEEDIVLELVKRHGEWVDNSA